MSQVSRNIIANYAGSFWTALMGLAFVPLYIRFMGIESYGLVGIFTSLQAIFSVMDMGISNTLNREIARRLVPGHDQSEIRDLVRTLEIIYWVIALILGLLVVLLSFPIANYWVTPEKLSIQDVQTSVIIMGIIICLRWPISLYSGGLMGLQRQVTLNILNVVIATVKGAGAIVVLWAISPTIQIFLTWHIFVACLETVACAYWLWISLPTSAKRPGRFRKRLLVEVWHFAAAMFGINAMSMSVSQIDKVILSKMLPLQAFGYYMLAWTAVSGIFNLVGPIYNAVFPKFSQLVSTNDITGIKSMYHKSCQLMSVIVLPVSLVLCAFSYHILLLWTSNPVIAQQTYLVLSVLSLGSACSAVIRVPMAVQLAYGWTSLLLWLHVVAIVIVPPVLIVLISCYGKVGGALSWTLFNVGVVLICVPIMHHYILKGENRRYYVFDIGLPFLAAAMVILPFRFLLPEHESSVLTLFIMCAATGLAMLAAAVSASCVRNSLRTVLESLVLGFRSRRCLQSRGFRP